MSGRLTLDAAISDQSQGSSMEQRAISEHETSAERAVPVSPEEIRRTIDRILNSKHFSQAPKKRKFVQMICDYHLAGRAKEINEHLIGLEVYERNDRYSPAEDPVVRVAAHDVRKRLEQYYLHEGKDDEIRLEIPIGSYEPVFRSVSGPLTDAAPSVAGALAQDRRSITPLPLPEEWAGRPGQGGWRGRGLLVVVVSAFVILASIAVFFAISARRKTPAPGMKSELDLYGPVWETFFTSEDPTIEVLSNPPVYVLVNIADPEAVRKKSVELSKERSRELFDLLKQTTKSEPEYPAPSRLYLSPTGYTGVGEAIGAHCITGLFRSRGVGVTLKQSRNLTAEDLKDRNLIMLGGRWSNAWAGKLPVKEDFYFTPQVSIANRHTQPGEQSEYRAKFDEAGQLVEDYALITVKPSARNKNTIMALEGLRGVGTGAAAEMITNKNYLGEINQRLRQLSGQAGLPHYYQILLKADVENNVATKLTLLAVHKIEGSEEQ
jgi:hypothetical protein